jgi:hypothetical protein
MHASALPEVADSSSAQVCAQLALGPAGEISQTPKSGIPNVSSDTCICAGSETPLMMNPALAHWLAEIPSMNSTNYDTKLLPHSFPLVCGICGY